MNERSFFSVFQNLFFITGIPFAIILWGMLDLPWHRALIVAIVAGISLGLVIAYFIRGSEVSFATDPTANMSMHISGMLYDMGYKKEHQFHKTTTFKPTWRAGLFADRIVMNIHENEVMLCGPKVHVDKVMRHVGV